ncbi:MAG: HAD family hydrolase [Deltaproteobacteria bacterium]|nr:HAD family hydrolase [Deltaproteobacteria bacterium]
MKPAIRMVVTDLDNTLYDWVTFFTASFYRMVDVAAEKLGVTRDRLLDELREVHRSHRNSEQPFALLETSAVKSRYPNATRSELAKEFRPVFQEFNRVRKEKLKLYAGVEETLQRLQRNRIQVIGHTEATVPNALYRLRALELEPFFVRLYAATPSGSGHYDKERGESLLRTTIDVRYLRPGERKPDPRVLLDICREMGIAPQQTLYIGDSISRDIGMAKGAGVWAAWAQYGAAFDPELGERLARITHWSEEDIRRTKEAQARHGNAKPDRALRYCISEIFDAFTF